MKQNKLIIVRGAGEMASGVIYHLIKNNYPVIALEQPNPVCVRRNVAFANAYYEKQVVIEGVKAILAANIDDATKLLDEGVVPILIDPKANSLKSLNPLALIEARMFKKPIDTNLLDMPLIIGLGPGFEAKKNCHAVVETNRGENLGNLILKGTAEKYTGIPAKVNSYTHQRVLRSPAEGSFTPLVKIRDMVKSDQIIGHVNNIEVVTQISGMVRGLIHQQVKVRINQKIGDIDPRADTKLCYKISDKAHAIGEGVLNALSMLTNSAVTHTG
jgi:xanthine dehydrogenase accessory factor